MTSDEDWLAPLRAKFANRLPGEIEALRAAWARRDRETIIERAHKLAGLAGMVGAPEVGETALQLEESARSGADYAGQLSQLIAAIERARG
ncbi:Hpt domain-containing protein [Erythrobacter sp. NE805]|uniref:Hpt domain-containing protein n=1 Tax=Erythrobacter sp. NE805 TaxID=3389875 RepID=UPI00396B2EAA